MQNGEVARSTSRPDLTPQDGKISHLLSFASDAEKNAFPTLFALSENDIESIWSDVSSFIGRQMACQKGVHITGLGTFTFAVQKIVLGRQHKLIHRPIFLLAEKLKHFSGLKQRKALPDGGVPVVPLNFSTLSTDSPFERDVVKRCVRDILIMLMQAVSSQPTVLLGFYNIGLLSFRRGWACMRFCKDFLEGLDRSWSLFWANNNSRAGVSSSVASDRVRSNSCSERERNLATFTPSHSSVDLRQELYSALEHKEEREEGEGKKGGNTLSQPHRRETLKPAKVSGIFLTEDLNITPQEPNRPPLHHMGQVDRPPLHHMGQVDRPPSHPCTDERESRQELCLLCKERAEKNVSDEPVPEAERRRQEKQEERLFVLRQQQADQELMLQQEVYQEMCRQRSMRIAACNLEMAEAKEGEAEHRSEKFYGSYIFRTRPDTPPQLPRQRQYLHDLLDQVQNQDQRQGLDRQTQELVDRMGQMELDDEIVEQQRQQQLLMKDSGIRSYQRALDTQCDGSCRVLGSTTRLESSLSRPSYSKDLVFGPFDAVPSAAMEQRQRARELHRHQINVATLRRRHMHFSRILEQKREIDVLRRTREEVRADYVTRHNKLRRMRKELEDAWAQSVEAKRQRDQEEKAFMRAGRHLVINQCNEYQRCQHCRRRLSFCGGTNLWKESRYIPGSRLML
ncbi:hypothetical protein ACEWY4_023221 [Coilia grayii]|uniref:Coiled-coil domain-containing protein 81 n=1 Tax=Coilia grayii TaxID=363190 RepID=A0ABD1J2F6_9TELE